MSLKDGVLEAPSSILEAPGLDFGGFWDRFFEIWGLLARKMQELIANLEPTLRDSSLELELPVLLPSTSKFGRDLLHQRRAKVF